MAFLGININASSTKNFFKALNENINSSVQSVVNNNSQNCSAVNTVNLRTGSFDTGTGYEPCYFETAGGLNIGQTAVADCSFTVQNMTDMTSDFKSALENAVTETVQQDAQNESGFISTGTNINIQNVSNENEVINRIINSSEQYIQTSCEQNATAGNNAVIGLCGYFGEGINIDQDASITAITSCLNQSVLEAFTNDTVLNNFLVETDQVASNRSEGIASIFSAFWLPIVIGVIALIIIIIIIVVVVILSRSGKKEKEVSYQKITPAGSPRQAGVSQTAGVSRPSVVNRPTTGVSPQGTATTQSTAVRV